ncbi:MAG TPA: shikimate dehydrogenase [Luteibaculaceae bacterium]|nr:shikimate dehydrogenase [Luteibaculaceae bacterium]
MSVKKLGLIGQPLSHSFSKKYFQQKFDSQGIREWSYDLYPLAAIGDLPSLWASEPNLVGLNVTIPYKEQVMPLLTELSDEARLIGAVNCIKRVDGGWRGYNTDAYGFSQSIKPFLEPSHDRALVLGSGGASKAVVYVLNSLGIPSTLVSRQSSENAIAYGDLNEAYLKHHRLIVNTTPCGMYPHVDELPPIKTEAIGEGHFVVDLIYNPEETKLLKISKAQGAMVLNGLSMLQLQAERSWEIWSND